MIISIKRKKNSSAKMKLKINKSNLKVTIKDHVLTLITSFENKYNVSNNLIITKVMHIC